MLLNDELAEWAGKLYKLAYEKTVLLDRIEIISKEMAEITGAVNAFGYMAQLPGGNENGDLLGEHNDPARDDPRTGTGEDQPGAGAETPASADA